MKLFEELFEEKYTSECKTSLVVFFLNLLFPQNFILGTHFMKVLL